MNIRILALATASLASLAATQAHAEAEADGANIIVTAQLREQDPIDVPMALSAISAEELDRFGLQEFDELSRFVPGFVVQNQSPNNPGFVMRGITSDSGAATTEPRVSVYQDGVSISKSRGSYVELFDVERVEIAKGPQSTLYGRGALIGAVNVIQNKANPDAIEGAAGVSYGNHESFMAEAMLNAPVGENVAVRLSGRIRQRDGYVENLLGGADFDSADTKAIRGAIHAGSGGFTFDLIGNYQEDSPAGTSFKSIAYNPTDPTTGAVIGDRGRNSGAALATPAGFEGGRPLGLERDVWGVTGIASLELDDRFKLTSITAYRRFSSLEIFDADGISLPILTAAEDARGKQFSQELRLAYEAGPLTAFVGASYFHEDGSQRTPAQFDERMTLARLSGALNGGGAIPGRPATDPAPAALFANTAFAGQLLQGVAGAYGVALDAALAQAIAANLKSSHLETSTNSARTNAVDLFGDVTLRVAEQFELGAGLRYTHDDKRSSYTAAVLNGRSILGGFIGALGLAEPLRTGLLQGLAAPGAATIPPSAAYPVPLFGLGAQPTANNGDIAEADHKDSGFSWRITARYIAGPDSSIYAAYARGRRPEILSPRGPGAPFGAAGFNVLPSETVDSFEIGAKTALMDRTLFVDGAVFFYQYENFQTTEQQGTQFITTNAGKAESYGFEGQVRWVPNDMFSLFATYGYSHGRFKTGVRDGNRFRLSPDHSASLGTIVTVPAGPGRISFSPSVTVQSRIFFDDDNDRTDLQQPPAALVADNIQDEYQDGYALVNARLGYEAADGGWRVEAFVENLFDKEYIMDAGNTGDSLGLPTFIAGAPRYYGIAASVRFGGVR
ncbi:MAG: TonB-dependent receptor [Alphaproteobacteria bacterium]|nr:TonB-dependent receptor [Alphaproteobacteria bacterium]MBU0793920.1 TonB-dependent receptor [Alphaproteobacteria bacterium]MBU0875834.1 TonB-dependent receptor [Alphaproteobacteria bacterium]MBU1769986.1 TonB-dependent receptor [Alphaproteobacteria bacterium]